MDLGLLQHPRWSSLWRAQSDMPISNWQALLVHFIDVYLPLKHRSQRLSQPSDIKYLNNTQLWLAESISGLNLRNRIFLDRRYSRILRNHKYFQFRPFSDKNNNLIFFKCPKTLFWMICDLFFGVFPKVIIFLNNE